MKSVLYFQKAFDSVPHWLLLTKLESLEFSTVILRWLSESLSYMQYSVCGSEWRRISVNSSAIWCTPRFYTRFFTFPYLYKKFTIFPFNKNHLYADDVLLYHTINSPEAFWICLLCLLLLFIVVKLIIVIL